MQSAQDNNSPCSSQSDSVITVDSILNQLNEWLITNPNETLEACETLLQQTVDVVLSHGLTQTQEAHVFVMYLVGFIKKKESEIEWSESVIKMLLELKIEKPMESDDLRNYLNKLDGELKEYRSSNKAYPLSAILITGVKNSFGEKIISNNHILLLPSKFDRGASDSEQLEIAIAWSIICRWKLYQLINEIPTVALLLPGSKCTLHVTDLVGEVQILKDKFPGNNPKLPKEENCVYLNAGQAEYADVFFTIGKTIIGVQSKDYGNKSFSAKDLYCEAKKFFENNGTNANQEQYTNEELAIVCLNKSKLRYKTNKKSAKKSGKKSAKKSAKESGKESNEVPSMDDYLQEKKEKLYLTDIVCELWRKNSD